MPSVPGRQRTSRGRHIKPDPEPITNGASTKASTTSHTSEHDGDSTMLPVGQSFYRYGRSDAPTPSEPEPLLREMRMPTLPVVAQMSNGNENSFFDTSFQDIGKKLKACNDTLGELQQLGVSHDVQLPELVLVGDQSAGKSSLMSGLANLELPRSEGTCTRCPLHIRVSRNSEWSCRVWLRKEFTYQPPQDRPITENDVTDQDPFFPWRRKKSFDTKEFKTMRDKAEIEDVLRWAQVAILNDDKQPELFVPGSGPIAQSVPLAQAAEETTAKFSPNIVALEIKGPDLPDLSFYDMPGIFQNPADARDDYLVSVVRNLSMAYIGHPAAIILCAMPMNSDAENSSTFGLTRKLSALSRTIGVLTKADLIPEGGSHEQWLSIMRSQAHQTGLGYFITSRPQGKDLEELQNWEQVIFEQHSFERWPAAFHEFSHRSGIEKLKAFLSERLGEEFLKNLPDIRDKVKCNLDKIEKQLGNLPPLPENVELEVQRSLINFEDKAKTRIHDLTRHFNQLPREFRQCLLDIKPKFKLKDPSDAPVVEISDDESDAASVITATNTPSKRRNGTQPATPAKRPRNDGSFQASFHSQVKQEDPRASVQPLMPNGTNSPGGGAPRAPSPTGPFAKFSNVGRGFRSLRQVRDEILEKSRAGLPDRIPDEVYDDLMHDAVMPWNKPMEVFLDETMNQIHHKLETTLDQTFASLQKRLIYREAKRHLGACLNKHRQSAWQTLCLYYDNETQRLLTFNDQAFQLYRKEEYDMLVWFRHQQRMAAAKPTQARQLPPWHWDKLTEEKRLQELKQCESETARIGPDPFRREVEVVSYVRGYYRLAALRFADTVSQLVICKMIPDIRLELSTFLREQLGLLGPDAAQVYEKLMEEDATTAQKRKNLRTEREKFVKAMASITSLESGPQEMSRNEEAFSDYMDDDDATEV